TDIFSLGVVLYELATGRRPFAGRNQAELISSIMRDEPPPLAEARQDAPNGLARIIDRCLRKEPKDRFPTARDVCNELRDVRREMDSGVAVSRPAASPSWVHALGGAAILILAVAVLWGWTRWGGRRATGTPLERGAAIIHASNSVAVLPFINMSSDKE